MRTDGRARRILRSLATGLVIALAMSGCEGGDQETIRVGFIGDCKGGLSPYYESAVAGAELPFIRRGAKPLGAKPSDGVGSVSIGGKRVELLVGCDHSLSLVSTFAEARRLVEQEGAAALVTPFYTLGDPVSLEYARHQPSVAFVSTDLGQQTTLVDPPNPNVFRFNMDISQTAAGLGSYAYRELGWRTAVTFSEEFLFGWTLTAGFVAEFCSLGGTVVRRYWAPREIVDWSPLVRRIPRGVDGVALMAGLQGTSSFFSAYRKVQPDLKRHVVMSATPIALGQRPVGIVAAGPLPFVSTAPDWTRYFHDLRATFPSALNAPGLGPNVQSSNAVEAVLEALEQVDGDLSGGGRRFMRALATLRLRTPAGTVRLDAKHQAVGPNFLMRVEKDADGRLVPRTIRVIPNVEQTFNGYFTPSSPLPSSTQPVCRKGNPPPWAR